MDDWVVFVPYGSRLGFHENGVASTMANIDYKFPQCVCYEHEYKLCYAIDHVITTGGNCTAQGPCVYKDICPTEKAGGVHAVCYEVDHE